MTNKSRPLYFRTSLLVLLVTGSYLLVTQDATKLDTPGHDTIPAPAVLSSTEFRADTSAGTPPSNTASDDTLSEGYTAKQEALLKHPKVQAYFDQQQAKKALDAYFNNKESEEVYTDEEIWQIIERIESEGRVFAFEALSLKLRWLEKNADNELDFKARSEDLIAGYRARAEAAQNYQPESELPAFAEYKKEEARIIKEIESMQSFPEGMTRQEYLRKSLLEARIKAYSS